MAAVLLAEPVVAVAEPLLERLHLMGICVPRSAEVRDYVNQFPDLVQVIRKGCELSATEFADRDTLSLELYVDPEIDDRYLSLYIRQTAYEPNIMERIERVQAEADAYLPDVYLNDSAGWFLITTDFQPSGERRYGL